MTRSGSISAATSRISDKGGQHLLTWRIRDNSETGSCYPHAAAFNAACQPCATREFSAT